MKALRRYLPEIDLDEEEIAPEVIEKMEVRMSDFQEAVREIEPSALRRYTYRYQKLRGKR